MKRNGKRIAGMGGLLFGCILLAGCSYDFGAWSAESEPKAVIRIQSETDGLSEQEMKDLIASMVAESEGRTEVEPGDVLSEEEIEEIGLGRLFYQSRITDSIFERIDGKSYKEGCPVSRDDLRYLRILHYDFDHNIRAGELICHKALSDDMMDIFLKLYEAEYPIEKVLLVDEYGADDDLSSSDNNTSCFNYRNVSGGSRLSMHAYGAAIDINPLYNPYLTWPGGQLNCAPANGTDYIDRSRDFLYKIDEEDLCYQLFTEAGFSWGGSWQSNPDYMHFSRSVWD